jgi:hypothetical protein
MRITIGTDTTTLDNFKKSFLALRPKLYYQGNNLNIKFKSSKYQIPLTIVGNSSKGFTK